MATVPLPPVSRVGILAKSHLRAATPHLLELGEWLSARGIRPVYETATAALMPSAEGRDIEDKMRVASDVDDQLFQVLPVRGLQGLQGLQPIRLERPAKGTRRPVRNGRADLGLDLF